MIKGFFYQKSLQFIMVCFLFDFFLLISFLLIQVVNAQSIPPPPPSSDLPAVHNDKVPNGQTPLTHQSPTIQILNNDLKQGKNVLRIKIEPESGIKECTITYLHQQKPKVADCVIDHSSIYKALIDADIPSQSLKIYVKNIYGDISFYFKELDVIKEPTLLDTIWNILFHQH
jgi:hypothetical protein